MPKFNFNKPKPNIKLYLACLSITILIFVTIFALSSSVTNAQTSNVWNIQRNTSNNDLDFYLTTNGVSGSSLRLNSNGTMRIRSVYDLDDSTNTFVLDPSGTTVLNTLSVTNLNPTNLNLPGNVGIGDTNPAYKLVVSSGGGTVASIQGGSTSSPALLMGIAGGDSTIGRMYFDNASARFRFFVNGIDNALVVNTTGVGIGTNTPLTKLDVRGTASVNGGALNGPTYLAPGALTIGDYGRNYGGGTGWNTNTAGLFLEAAANTEIAVHDAAHRIASLMYFEGDALNRITIGRNMGWGSISTVVISGNTTCICAPPSDIRIKTDIKPLTQPLEKIMALEGIEFEFTNEHFPDKSFPEGRQIGLVAQNVEKVIPQVVITDPEGFKTLQYQNLTALLIEGVKTQQNQLNSLKNAIDDIKLNGEGEIETIKLRLDGAEKKNTEQDIQIKELKNEILNLKEEINNLK